MGARVLPPGFPIPADAVKAHIHDMAFVSLTPMRRRCVGAFASTFPIPTVAEKLRKPHIHDMAVCVPDPDAARASAQLSDSPVAARMSRQRFIEKAVRAANYSASRRYLRRTAWLGRSRFSASQARRRDRRTTGFARSAMHFSCAALYYFI